MAAKWDSGSRWDDGVTFWDRATAAVNTTDGALRLTATGLAATTIAWNGTLYGPEVG